MPDFEDPFRSPESTVLRPRPGAGRRGAPDAPPPSSRPAPGGAGRAEAVPVESIEALGIGLSPLVRAASPLLLLTGQLRGMDLSDSLALANRCGAWATTAPGDIEVFARWDEVASASARDVLR